MAGTKHKLLHSAYLGLALMVLTACSSSELAAPFIELEHADIDFTVPAEGELIASESMPIALPGSIRMAFNISWLAPEFSDIRKGDVIARFDDVQVKLDKESTTLNVAKSSFKLADSTRDGKLERTRITHESFRVDGERDISESFSEADEKLFSRIELIDTLSDLEYLDVESAFLQWQYETLDQRTDAEQNLILAEQEGELSKLEKQDMALEMMELRSPADGTFVYASTPWGEKLGKGKTIYPGMPIGLLPVRGKVRARLFVPEMDAVGIQVGQEVRFYLDSATEKEFIAQVATISPVASPRNRTNPQKFFSVEADIEEVDPELMRVGNQLRAQIITGKVSNGLVVPVQSLEEKAGNAFVYLVDGNGTEQRKVQLGQRSPDLVELLGGAEAGDRVSLVPPVQVN